MQSGTSGLARRVIVTADDFGLSPAVNEAVEQAHRNGILTSASLMVAAPAAADAIQRARILPSLRVGLHLVLVDGPAVLPRSTIPDLVDDNGLFPRDQLRLGLRYTRPGTIRRQLAAEIRAQFAAFAATGLPLDHADAHKHMHLHPVVGALMIRIGREFGLRTIRVPAEPPAILRACGERPGLAAAAMHRWTSLLRWQARRAGLSAPDQVFGIAWSGHVTADRLRRLAAHLPAGRSEIYLHPAVERDATLQRLMPDYDHVGELRALLDPELRPLLRAAPLPAAPPQ